MSNRTVDALASSDADADRILGILTAFAPRRICPGCLAKLISAEESAVDIALERLVLDRGVRLRSRTVTRHRCDHCRRLTATVRLRAALR